jgi:hypothetical protein
MKRAIVFLAFLLTATTTLADYRPVFRSGYWTGTVRYSGQVIDSWQVIETNNSYQLGPVPDFDRQVQSIFYQLKSALDDKAREAIAGQGTFSPRPISGPLYVDVDPPLDATGRRSLRFRLASYRFGFDVSGWVSAFHVSCHVEAYVNDFSFSVLFNPVTRQVESVSASYPEPQRSVTCSLIGVNWLGVIGNIIQRWITPGPGDIFRTVGGLAVGSQSITIVSRLTGNPQAGEPPLNTQLQALGAAPLMGQMSTASMVLGQYIRPPSVTGVAPPATDGSPQTWQIFSGTFATNVGQYAFELRRTEIFDFVWYCTPRPGAYSCIEP